MKLKFRTVALLAVLSIAAVSCEKENIVDNAATTGEVASMQMVTYTVDGVTSQVVVLSEDAWNDFLDWMFALAEEGHRVSFRRGVASERIAAKETITYTTSDQQDAYMWANQMVSQGYLVTVDYDKKTGIYTCIAIK